MRLVDADAVALCLVTEGQSNSRKYGFKLGDIIKFTPTQVGEIIRKMPTIEPEQQWIPVSERLPEKDGEYLVCYEEGYREDRGFNEIDFAPFEVECEGFGVWREIFDEHTFGRIGDEWVDIPVTAWMPKPEPYKEADDD